MHVSPGRGAEAPPVLTGKNDDLTTFKVFKGWKADAKDQAELNPWVEIDKARDKRDELIRKYGVRLLDFVGAPKTERIKTAQHDLMRFLFNRGWGRSRAVAYFGRPITRTEWLNAVTTKWNERLEAG